MSEKNNDTINEAIYELHEEAGLLYWGRNDDGEDEWVGSDKAWRKFSELTNKL